jgi:hypothetical protein
MPPEAWLAHIKASALSDEAKLVAGALASYASAEGVVVMDGGDEFELTVR